jgi:hypothetical protein
MTDLNPLFGAFLIAFLLVTPFPVFLRGRWLAFAVGATVVPVLALLLEALASSRLDPTDGPVFVLVLVAPLVEELLKFGVSGVTGKDARAAAGVGTGFAATENALYFFAAWGSGLGALAVLVAVRTVTDPLLHSTSTTLATLSWRGRLYGLPAALLLHIGWNASAAVIASVDPLPGLLLLASATLTVLGILWWVHRNPSLRDAIAPVPTRRFARAVV